jgi:mRNA interferase RelE/StbE
LRDAPECYKVKLRAIGYRLVYQVMEAEVVVLVLAVGRRDSGLAYRKMKERQ